MSRLTHWISLGSLTAALTACPSRTPPPPLPSPSALQLPPGCDRSQAGDYYHAENPAFRYRGEDDGGTLTLSVMRAGEERAAPQDGGSEDGGSEDGGSEDGGSEVSLVLRRTPAGFVGETRATTFTRSGTACPVSFPTQATRCDAAGLTLRAVASTALDENCAPASSGPTTVWKEQRLLRGAPDAGAPDAGAVDAGTPDAGTSTRP